MQSLWSLAPVTDTAVKTPLQLIEESGNYHLAGTVKKFYRSLHPLAKCCMTLN